MGVEITIYMVNYIIREAAWSWKCSINESIGSGPLTWIRENVGVARRYLV